MNRAVFLDRDGTMIAEKHYLHEVEQVEILPGAARALKELQDAGFKLFIVSNQSGVGRGYFTLANVNRVNEHLRKEFHREGVRFEEVYIAPEAPDAPSRDGNRRRSFSSTRAMPSASTLPKAISSATSSWTWNAAGMRA